MITYPDKNRILFLDNLRYLMVLLVVILHSAISYSNMVPWWCVTEPSENSAFFNVVLVLLDVFLMPVLYFIAGYFAIPSYQQKGARLFLKAKCKRLGLPLLIGLPLVGPSFSYIYHYMHNGFYNEIGFGQYWVTYIKSIRNFHVGIMNSIDQFNQSYLWFISLLLFFFIIFALFASNNKCHRHQVPLDPTETTSTKWIAIILAVVGLLSTISALIAATIFASPNNPAPWVTIGNFLQFEPVKLVSYMLYFSMGIYAYHGNWFIKAKLPGYPAVWALSCVLLSLGLLITLKQLVTEFSVGIFILYHLVRSFLCISFLAALTSWAVGHWNRPSHLNALLASNSYYIYITHFIIVILLQLLLAMWPAGSVFIKFGFVSFGSILVSLGISHYAIKSYPRLTVIGICSMFIIMLLFIHPTVG